MILKPSRSAAELATRLQAISVLVPKEFVESEERRLPILGPMIRWLVLLFVLYFLTLAAYLVTRIWHENLIRPSDYSVQADDFLAKAHEFEEEAREYRALAAGGKAGTIKPGGLPATPRMALRLSRQSEQQAAAFRKLAHAEECKNQGYPVP